MKHIFCGLSLMHERNFIHRDLKPENILLNFSIDKESKKEIITAKIADFGLSAEYKFSIFSGQENIDEKMGTIIYMAPE
jgi:serine/threonine protein kinase